MGQPKFNIGSIVKRNGWFGKIKEKSYNASLLPKVRWSYKIGDEWYPESELKKVDWRDIRDLTRKED